MSDQDILIKIVTAYSEGGLEKARKAAEDLKESCKDSAGGSDTLSKAMEVLSSKGGDAGKTIRGLFDLMNKDGPGAVAGLGKSIEGLASTFGMALGPAGAIASIAMAGFQVVKGIMDAQAQAAEEAARKAKEEAEKAAEAAEEAAKRAEEAAEGARGKINGIAEGFMNSAKAAHELDDAIASMEDAQLELDLAKIDEQIAATTDPGKIAELRSRKAELKNDAAETKRARQEANLTGQIDALDQGEQAAKAAADEARKNYEELRARVERTEQAARGGEVLASQWEERYRQNPGLAGQIDPVTHVRNPTLQEVADMRKEADRSRVTAAHGRESMQIAESERDAASEAYADLVLANIPKRRELELKRDTLGIRRQTASVSLAADLREIEDKRREEQKKADEAAAEANKPPAPTPGSLWRDASGQIGRGQRWKDGQLYDIDNGQTQQKARQALSDAGKAMAAGKSGDDAQIISELVAALEEMGAVVNDRNKMLQDLQQAVALLRQQAKNARG